MKNNVTKKLAGAASKLINGNGQNGKKSKNAESLEKLFKEALKDIYWAEKHLLKALTKMAKAASSDLLVTAFEDHHAQTEEQVKRLEDVFEACDLKVAGKKCEAMVGLVEEGEEVISEFEKGPLRDAGLIIAAQKVEHYEMATYGSLRTLAEVMGNTEAADLLQQTLDEEGDTDKKLTEIAMQINSEAYNEAEEELEGASANGRASSKKKSSR